MDSHDDEAIRDYIEKLEWIWITFIINKLEWIWITLVIANRILHLYVMYLIAKMPFK
jgi:hypothetical protein